MYKKAGKIALMVLLVMISLFVILTISVYLGAFGRLDSGNDLVNFKNSAASTVLSDNGELLGKFYSENRTNIKYEQIPAHLVNALIATEDARFFEHRGVDSKSLLRVLLKTILFQDRSSGGGSTLTQQLAKNMFGRRDFGILTVPVSKIKEVLLAFRLERIFNKEEIVTLYLNTVAFGENIYGIGTAARRYFNKDVSQLNTEESAVLVGMLKANTRYNPRLHPENAESRRNVVLKQMEKYKYLTRQEADSLCRLKMVLNYTNPESGGPADYFLFQVKNEAERVLEEIYLTSGKKWDLENDGLVITTTLDLALQNYATRSFRDHLSVMQERLNEQYRTQSGRRALSDIAERELKRLNLTERSDEITLQEIFDWKGSSLDSISVADSLKHSLTVLHAGLIAINPDSGAIKAWVGGIDFKSQPYDQVLARRQLASIFKPVLYAAALEEGMEPCQYLDNDSIVLADFEDYSPENYDHSYGGKYSLAGALAQSMNVPTFSLFLKIGFPRVDSMWKAMGFSFRLEDAPSIALGTAEASIKEIAVAYSAFVNGGFMISPQALVSIKDPEGVIIWENDFSQGGGRVLSERSAILMSEMLQKAIREGTGVSMSGMYGVSLPLAGKTGTSQNYADAWFAAFNPGLTIVSRVGASTPLVHFNSGSYGSGSTLALPLVALTLRKVQQDRELRQELFTSFPPLPPELEGMLDCPDFREENFFDRIRDLFEDEKDDYEKDKTRPRRDLRSIIRRIFRR